MFLQKTLLIALSIVTLNFTAYAQESLNNKPINTEKIYQMALLHLKPKASKEFKKKGISLMKEAGENGHLKAQITLTRAYKRGYMVEKNDRKAFIWASKAAAQDNAEAKTYLGEMYLKGIGTQKDKKKGTRLLIEAKNQGFAKAKEKLDALEV
ncbi:MAG: tetratricopeptide repeat protein [Flavicella sp.]